MPESPKLTDRQQQILDLVQSAIERTGAPPTRAEIANELGFRSANAAEEHLQALARKGVIELVGGTSRGIRLQSDTLRALNEARGKQYSLPLPSLAQLSLPLVGRVAAGAPLLAVENIEDTVKVDRFFIGQTREVFALRVKGDSMIEDGIFDGDFIFVRKQLHANRGEIVVAMIEDEATVKRYYPEGDNIRFQPANSSMQPIMVRKRDFKSVNLIGVVVGVYRKMRV